MSRWLFRIKKHLWCRFFHWRDRCYPEVWGRGLNGPWHCARCHPCGEALEKLLEQFSKEKDGQVDRS